MSGTQGIPLSAFQSIDDMLAATKAYPYWMHCTGDVRNATWKVGDTLIHERGHLTALDHPEVLAVAARYPGRPGV